MVKMRVFNNYLDAYGFAEKMAKTTGIDYGIERKREFGEEIFVVKLLPRPENCYGYELRMERVRPSD
jgi:hypothetical protein